MAGMAQSLATTFTGLRFENPFLLASAPPPQNRSKWCLVVRKLSCSHFFAKDAIDRAVNLPNHRGKAVVWIQSHLRKCRIDDRLRPPFVTQHFHDFGHIGVILLERNIMSPRH